MDLIDRANDAYFHDSTYHALVDVMVGALIKLELTPSEIRQAAVFAAIKCENLSIKPMTIYAGQSLKDTGCSACDKLPDVDRCLKCQL